MRGKISKQELIQETLELKKKSVVSDEFAVCLIESIEELALREKELNAIMNGSKAVLGATRFYGVCPDYLRLL